MGTMINRRRAYGGEKLPQGAVRIEYLESSGTQFIYGTRPISTIDYIEYHFNNSNTGGFVGINGLTQIGVNDYRYGTTDIGFYKLVGTKGTDDKWTIHNITKDIVYKNNYNGDVTCTNGLFSLQNESRPASIRLYEYLSKSEGVLTEHFIPVRIGQVGYMYDKVSGQLFGNSGTGNFILGPDV